MSYSLFSCIPLWAQYVLAYVQNTGLEAWFRSNNHLGYLWKNKWIVLYKVIWLYDFQVQATTGQNSTQSIGILPLSLLRLPLEAISMDKYRKYHYQDFPVFIKEIPNMEVPFILKQGPDIALPTCTPQWLTLINTQPATSMQTAHTSLGCTTKARNRGILPWYTIFRLRQDQLLGLGPN